MAETKSEASVRRNTQLIFMLKSQVDDILARYAEEPEDDFGPKVDQDSLNDLYPTFTQSKRDLISLISIEQVADYNNRFREFEEAYRAALITVHRSLAKFERNTPPTPPPTPQQNIKLPDIRLPSFNGDIEQWVSFRDRFSSMVGNREMLPDAQKLEYLKSVLQGDAALVQAESDTFLSLWEALVARYENNKLITCRHISEILSLRTIPHESAAELREMLQTLVKNMRVLKSMNLERNQMVDQILITLVSSRLDEETRKAYELQQPDNALPTYDEMMKFLERRCNTLEAIAKSKKPIDKAPKPCTPRKSGAPKTTSLAVNVQNSAPKCPNCEKNHFISRCLDFLNLAPEKRVQLIKTLNLCFNCFSSKHSVDQCRRGNCRECNRKHNTLLHIGKDVKKDDGTPEVSTLAVTVQSHITTGQQVLVSTAVISVSDSAGTQVFCRVFLDSCSQSNLMTEQLAQTLRLKRIPIKISLGGVLGKDGSVKRKTVAKIQSRTSDFAAELEFLLVPTIASGHNNIKFSKQTWNIPPNIELADPYFATPHRLDMLLGAEIFFDLWTSQNLKLESGLPPLRGSVFGWVVAGKVPLAHDQPAATSTLCAFVSRDDDDLLQQVKRFWELESTKRPIWSIEEKQVEQHFMDTHRRLTNGRYVVKLPTKSNVHKLGQSKQMALNRFHSLERRFARDPELRAQYTTFIKEYESLGHMQPSNIDLSQPTYDFTTYFLPHHAVLKPDAVSTKLRVVFDASACSTSGLSLNDVLRVGATIQHELVDTLMRFRKHRIAFTSDITKMYRQVLVDEGHHPLQQILWRDSPSEPLRAYSLKTVTYGTASAPFLATRALRQLALDEADKFPDATKVALNDFYVDDCLSGADSVEEALALKQQLTTLLNRGGFPLHKWSANVPELLTDVNLDKRQKGDETVNLSKNEFVKTLGLKWHASSDNFLITVDQSAFPEGVTTKRSVLSDIARLFDPLGLVSPIIVIAKTFLQLLWSQALDWDVPLSDEDTTTWQKFRCQLRDLHQITVPRRVIPFATVKTIRLIGFCDASETAYGCCLYIHCIDDDGQRAARLLCSKSRIAPVKTITLPRLELCGAVLLAELVAKIRSSIDIQFDQITLFTDSMVTLGWIRATPKRLKTFVGHRVAEIQDLTRISDWRHVPTADNPADLISRGCSPAQLQQMAMWWFGPPFLTEPENSWPSHQDENPLTDLPETKSPKTIVLVSHELSPPFPVLTKFSSFQKLQRILAYVQRFIAHCKMPRDKRKHGELTGSELAVALRHIVYAVQHETIAHEIAKLEEGKSLKKSPLFNLNLFIDDEKLVRVGGRLGKSNQSYDTKHQMILPRRHHVTTILLRDLHEQHGHVGRQGLLSIVRQRFWPVAAQQAIKDVTQRCVRCYRCRPKLTEQFMGELPAYRTTIVHPFVNTGVDYAGPMLLKVNHRTTVKAYIAVFVCMAVKAVHLELVSDLSTDVFIGALTRFMSRRGHCKSIYSDNGTNFVGASNEIKGLLADSTHQARVVSACAPLAVDFHFIPPRAPHFGGLWEAAVKSAKYHLVRIVGQTKLTYEEMNTVLTKVEAILNSRPLLAESNDPEDPTSITPGHFLIGRPLTALIEPDLTDISITRLRRWQMLQCLTQHFWRRWSREYLTSLQKRTKSADSTPVQLGAIVLIKDENLPPLQWPLGKVVDIHPGKDGVVRVVSIKTKNGTIKRAVVKVCLLPVADDPGELS